VELAATEEQKQQLAPIVKQAVKDLLPLREKARAARTQAVALLTGDSIDRAAIEALRAEHLQAAEEASRRIAQALADVAEVLTPAQRKDLAARMEKYRRGWPRGLPCRAVRRRIQCLPSRNLAVGMAERILLIEDDSRLAEMVSEYLGESGFRVSIAAGGRAGLERLAREPFDALVLDLTLPDMDGLEV